MLKDMMESDEKEIDGLLCTECRLEDCNVGELLYYDGKWYRRVEPKDHGVVNRMRLGAIAERDEVNTGVFYHNLCIRVWAPCAEEPYIVSRCRVDLGAAPKEGWIVLAQSAIHARKKVEKISQCTDTFATTLGDYWEQSQSYGINFITNCSLK